MLTLVASESARIGYDQINAELVRFRDRRLVVCVLSAVSVPTLIDPLAAQPPRWVATLHGVIDEMVSDDTFIGLTLTDDGSHVGSIRILRERFEAAAYDDDGALCIVQSGVAVTLADETIRKAAA